MAERDPFRLDGRVAAVVGAASGMAGPSRRCARAREPRCVLLLDQNEAGARAVASRIGAGGGVAEAGALDIRDAAAVTAAFESLRERRGSLDVAVCTPSVTSASRSWRTPPTSSSACCRST